MELTQSGAPHLSISRQVEQTYDAWAEHLVLASGLQHERSESWPTNARMSDFLGGDSEWTARASSLGDDPVCKARLAATNAQGHCLLARWSFQSVKCRVIADSPERALSLLTSLRRLMPEIKRDGDDDVSVAFWHMEYGQGEHITRSITAPSWAEVAGNYSSSTREQLQTLVRLRPAGPSGKLVLWHGPAGTGKTWALRALLREWSDWIDPHYILDPERFFGATPTYMLSVILDEEHDREGVPDGEQQEPPAHRWRLLIVEDAGELLGKDAKRQTGQGIARLLNLCDGLVGQGLRVLVLLTSNEEIGAMHPAVIRHGRCIANIRFDPLSAEESRRWLRAHGRAPRAERTNLLADLFVDGQIATTRQPIVMGFRPPAEISP